MAHKIDIIIIVTYTVNIFMLSFNRYALSTMYQAQFYALWVHNEWSRQRSPPIMDSPFWLEG